MTTEQLEAIAIAVKTAEAEGKVLVPMGCLTLHQAMRKVEESDGRLTTIVVGEGTHMIKEKEVDSDDEDEFYEQLNIYLPEVRMDQRYLNINSSLNIIGDVKIDKSKIVVDGGFRIGRNVEGNVHLEHMTVHADEILHGVVGDSSFTLKDLIIENCANSVREEGDPFDKGPVPPPTGSTGLIAKGSSTVASCHNVIVRNCTGSGVRASGGASIILSGNKTSVHGNCSGFKDYDDCWECGLRIDNEYCYCGEGDECECICSGDCYTPFGLEVRGPNSKITFVAPLTAFWCSKDNGYGDGAGGGVQAILGHSLNVTALKYWM
jgi:hypothetical protein